jgi:exonuclease III
LYFSRQNLPDYPHQFWFPAEKDGYSGVALLSKEKPIEVKVNALEHVNYQMYMPTRSTCM